MVSLNKMTIIGNLGSEPEMRFTRVADLSPHLVSHQLAVHPRGRRTERGHRVFNVVAWGKLAGQ